MMRKIIKYHQAGFFHPLVFWTRIKRFWPFLVWMGILIIAAYLYFQEERMGAFLGIVEGPRELTAPLETARLKEVHVEPGSEVEKGTVLAHFDTSLLDGELAMEWLEIERQFSGIVNEVEKELHNARVEYNLDRSELEAIKEEIEYLKDLMERRLISGDELTEMRIRKKILEDAVEMHPETVEKLRKELAQVKEKRDVALEWLGEGARQATLETFEWDRLEDMVDVELESHIERIGHLLQRRKEYTLRANRDGVVSQVFRHPGEVVSEGDTVLSLLTEGDYRVEGYLSEARAQDLRVGSEVYIARQGREEDMRKAQVVALEPEMIYLPEHVSPVPGSPLRGRKVIMIPDDDTNLIAGETVYVHITMPWWIRLEKAFWNLFSREKNDS